MYHNTTAHSPDLLRLVRERRRDVVEAQPQYEVASPRAQTYGRSSGSVLVLIATAVVLYDTSNVSIHQSADRGRPVSKVDSLDGGQVLRQEANPVPELRQQRARLHPSAQRARDGRRIRARPVGESVDREVVRIRGVRNLRVSDEVARTAIVLDADVGGAVELARDGVDLGLDDLVVGCEDARGRNQGLVALGEESAQEVGSYRLLNDAGLATAERDVLCEASETTFTGTWNKDNLRVNPLRSSSASKLRGGNEPWKSGAMPTKADTSGR